MCSHTQALSAFTLPPAAAAAHISALAKLSSTDSGAGTSKGNKANNSNAWSAKLLEGAHDVLTRFLDKTKKSKVCHLQPVRTHTNAPTPTHAHTQCTPRSLEHPQPVTGTAIDNATARGQDTAKMCVCVCVCVCVCGCVHRRMTTVCGVSAQRSSH